VVPAASPEADRPGTAEEYLQQNRGEVLLVGWLQATQGGKSREVLTPSFPVRQVIVVPTLSSRLCGLHPLVGPGVFDMMITDNVGSAAVAACHHIVCMVQSASDVSILICQGRIISTGDHITWHQDA
jgi:hypothetical protein